MKLIYKLESIIKFSVVLNTYFSIIYVLEIAKSMHLIHYKENNITSNLFKTAASIHKHCTRYSDKDILSNQPIFPSGEKQ